MDPTTKRVWIGIDPGLTGAVGVLYEDGRTPLVYDAPIITIRGLKKGHTKAKSKNKSVTRKPNIPGMLALFSEIKSTISDLGLVSVCLEDVASRPGQGVVSVFSFGHNKGLWEMLVASNGLRCEKVAPVVWKNRLLGKNRADKGYSAYVAGSLWPAVDFGKSADSGRAEALLLAEYLRKLGTGKPVEPAMGKQARDITQE